MNCIIRGVRVIDPLRRRDAAGQDVWLSEGRIIAIYKHMGRAPCRSSTSPHHLGRSGHPLSRFH